MASPGGVSVTDFVWAASTTIDDQLRGGLPPVVRDVLGDELVLLEFDLAGAAGELGDQVVGDSDDLPPRIAICPALAKLPLDSHLPTESVGEQGVVVRGQSGHRGEDRPTIEAAPAAIHHGEHLVGDDYMSVELQVTCT